MIDIPRTPSFRLEGRSAFVSGGSSGIGLAAAAALVEAGAEVVLAARSADKLTEAAGALGSQAHAHALDMTDLAAVNAYFAAADRFDIIVNCAGCNRPKPMADVTAADYNAVLDLNLKATYFVTQAAAAKMQAAKRPGSFIHVGSQMGHVGAANRTLYCASKWGLEGFSKALAVELAPYSIRSNTIAPTFIETPLTKPYFEDEAFRRDVLGKIKLGRIGQVEDLMGAVLFLASDASALVTGTSIVVDGGWTAE